MIKKTFCDNLDRLPQSEIRAMIKQATSESPSDAQNDKTGRQMTGVTQFRESIMATLFAVTILALCGYFFFAATQGPFGLYEKGRIEAKEVDLQARLAALRDMRLDAENRARRLSDTYLDLDLLDEQARKILGYARHDEIIIR